MEWDRQSALAIRTATFVGAPTLGPARRLSRSILGAVVYLSIRSTEGRGVASQHRNALRLKRSGWSYGARHILGTERAGCESRYRKLENNKRLR